MGGEDSQSSCLSSLPFGMIHFPPAAPSSLLKTIIPSWEKTTKIFFCIYGIISKGDHKIESETFKNLINRTFPRYQREGTYMSFRDGPMRISQVIVDYFPGIPALPPQFSVIISL